MKLLIFQVFPTSYSLWYTSDNCIRGTENRGTILVRQQQKFIQGSILLKGFIFLQFTLIDPFCIIVCNADKKEHGVLNGHWTSITLSPT